MKLIICACLILYSRASSCQVRWANTSDWTLYGYPGNDLFTFSLDSLKKMDTIHLDQESMTTYLSSAEVLHPQASIMWMGGYIATCRFKGVIRKIDLSNYGGFFYDENTKTYYQIPTEKTDAWLSYLQQSFLSLSKKQAQEKQSPKKK